MVRWWVTAISNPRLEAGREEPVLVRRERASLFCAGVALDARASGRSSSSLDVGGCEAHRT